MKFDDQTKWLDAMINRRKVDLQRLGYGEARDNAERDLAALEAIEKTVSLHIRFAEAVKTVRAMPQTAALLKEPI